MRIYFLLIILLSFSFTSFAQKAKIEVEIKGGANDTVFLVHHFDKKFIVDDTLKLNNQGKATIKSDTLLKEGLYALYLPSKKSIDFIIGDKQNIKIYTSKTNPRKDFKIVGSKQTEIFNEYVKLISSRSPKIRALHSKLKEARTKKQSTKAIEEEIKKVDNEVINFMNKTINDNKGTFLALFLESTAPPAKMPDFEKQVPKNVKDRKMKVWRKRYEFQRDHFINTKSLSDERILRTPTFKDKLDAYFNKVIIQVPDTVCVEIDKFVAHAKSSDRVYRYVLQFIMNNCLRSKIMGMEKAFMHVAQKYFLSNPKYWNDQKFIKKIAERAMHYRYNLIGMKAKNLTLDTPDGEKVSMHQIESEYTVLLFWEPDCGHCKTSTPKLYNEVFLNFEDKGVTFYAVYIQNKPKEWLEFIKKHSLDGWINCYDKNNITGFKLYYNVETTPVIYLLDKDKKIIAKNISVDTLKEILEERINKKKKITKS